MYVHVFITYLSFITRIYLTMVTVLPAECSDTSIYKDNLCMGKELTTLTPFTCLGRC